ncbi:hypothetical protein BGX34_004016 [Mortierella sp. NVP85]|nr:hypothetical protein BGX34_004016 [Mortierella sp. NVP85]
MEPSHQRRVRRQFEFDHGEETTTVQVLEVNSFTNCRKLLGGQEPRILTNIRQALKENGIHKLYPEDQDAWVMVRGLNWGDFSMSSELNTEGGLLQLLDDVSSIEKIRQSGNPGHIDLILGSDVFYNPPDFEPLLATVSYIINRHNPNCVFLTTYQNRSAKRNIDHLLEKWNLEGRIIDWEEFGFDLSKFIFADDEAGSGPNVDRPPTKELQGRIAIEAPREDDEPWLRRARLEVGHTMHNSPTVGTSGTHKVPLVDYSSGTESEDEMDTREDKDSEKTQAEQTATSGSKYQVGDGGSLNSVYLLWISKRRCGGRNDQR